MKLSLASVCAVLAIAMVALLILETHSAEAVTCSIAQLAPCSAAISSSAKPTSECCQKLKAQTPCLCGYLKNPSLRQYINSPNAKKVASTCGVSTPKC